MMKRLLVLSLAASLATVLVGCESSDSPKSPTGTPAASKGGPAPAPPVPTAPPKGKNNVAPGQLAD